MQLTLCRGFAIVAALLITWAAALRVTAQDQPTPPRDKKAPAAQPAPAEEKKSPTTQPTTPKVGDAAPSFELKALDDKTHRLADYKDKIVVLEWMNQGCPFSRGTCPKAKAIDEKYREKGVVWLAIDSTHNQTVEKNAKYVTDNKIPHPVLMDTDGQVGRRYGAKTTPHVFIIRDGKIVYAGAFDNDPDRSKPKTEYRGYVDEALDALLAGKPVPVASTDPWGCTVKYKEKK